TVIPARFGPEREEQREQQQGASCQPCPTLTLGSARCRRRGSHQFQRPSNSIVAGTITSRTMVASMKTAAARPKPINLIERRSATMKLANTHTMIAAAAVITRA